MRRISLPLLASLLLISSNLFGQKMPSDYFEEGEKFVKAKDYKNALASFQYIVKKHPKNILFPRAYFNVGYIYSETKQYDSAAAVFKSILVSNFNEKEDLGGDIMAPPFTNYRHRASEALSNIYYDKEMYDTALHYFALSDTVYRYEHFCGNEYASYDVFKALRYADIYEKLNKKDKAIEVLLPAVFISLSDNSEVITHLGTLLKGRKNLKSQLDSTLNNIYSKTIKRKEYTYTNHYFKFLNVEIVVPTEFSAKEEEFDKDHTIELVKNSDFYKMISSL